MANKLNFLINILLIVSPFLCASELPEWHMKPIGSHVKPEPVDETSLGDLISPEDFASKYVLPHKPIVFRDIVKTWPAYKIWTDEYLTTNYGDMEMRLEAKKEKQGMIPKGDICLGRDTLKTFLKDYREGADKYVVSDLPSPMYRDVMVPPPMACGDFLTSFVEIDLWVNSDMGKKGKGGNSIIHKDAFNTINCVLNGTKEWKLFELKYNDFLYQSWEGPMDAGYGGFSLVNPDKVDAKEFPDVGKIPNWQFATINAGDCLFLPSQMWHQVKSYGETNRAVAFLFMQFEGIDRINTTDCSSAPIHLPLSEVDVDWPYPGNGIMPMGNTEIVAVRSSLFGLIDQRTGYITKKRAYKFVYKSHSGGAINKKLMLEKTKTLYELLSKFARENKMNMTEDLIKNLPRDQIRLMYNLIEPIEPGNSYEHEYSHFLPEQIMNLIGQIQDTNDGKVMKDKFMLAYEEMGGTHSFAVKFWEKLAGDKSTIEDITETIEEAIRPYEEYRRNNPDTEEEDDDATITTPQGHVSQPKRKKGGYGIEKDNEEDSVERKENSNTNGNGEKKDEL